MPMWRGFYGVETKRVNEAVKNNPGVFEIYECNLVRRENILRVGSQKDIANGGSCLKYIRISR